MSHINSISLVSLVAAAFLAVVFLQSGLDKVLDYRGNLSWLKEHFAKSLLGPSVPFLLPLLTVLELIAGLLPLAAWITAFFSDDRALVRDVLCAAHLAALLALLALMFGQRVAKDYAGAVSLTGYVVIALIGLTTAILAPSIFL